MEEVTFLLSTAKEHTTRILFGLGDLENESVSTKTLVSLFQVSQPEVCHLLVKFGLVISYLVGFTAHKAVLVGALVIFPWTLAGFNLIVL